MAKTGLSYKMAQTSLHQWASLKTELLWVHDGPVNEEARDQVADHTTGYYLWVVRRGNVEVRADGMQLRAGVRQGLISPQAVIHQKFSGDASILSIHFHCQWPSGENLFTRNAGYVFDAVEYPRLMQSTSALCRLIHRSFPEVRTDFPLRATEYPVFLGFQTLFLRMLTEFSQLFLERGRILAHGAGCDRRVLLAIECMNDAPLHQEFPVTLLERATGSGRGYLDKLFWKELNLSTRGYWERLREDVAKKNLHNSSLSIKEVCSKLGFKQASHFTKWFLNRTGMTPTYYRKGKDSEWMY